MENPKNDQGQSAEESTSDPAVDGGGAAVEQKGTVKQGATPAEARKTSDAEGVAQRKVSEALTPRESAQSHRDEASDGAAPAKGKETEGNPYADLLKEYVPQKDYNHAQRKITEQGQELSARDTEVTQLRTDMQKLQAQVSTTSLIKDDDGYEVADEDAVSGRVVSELQQIREELAAQTERLNAQEDVIISSATEERRTRGVQTVKENLGLSDELAKAVQTLKEQGDVDGAIALAGKAAVIAKAERDKEALAGRQEEPIISGAQASGDVEPGPEHVSLKAEDLPEDISKRDGFHLKQIWKRFGRE